MTDNPLQPYRARLRAIDPTKAHERNTRKAINGLVDDLLRYRSKLLFYATSYGAAVKTARQVISDVDDLLLDALELLPDNAPVPRLQITRADTGQEYVLQTYTNGIARYVPLDKYQFSQFAYRDLTRRERLVHERSATSEVLDKIKALENSGENVVEADDELEASALLTDLIRNWS